MTLSGPMLVIICVLAAAQIALDLVALLDLWRRPTSSVVGENKWIWVLVILLVSTIGAILYLAIARKPKVAELPGAPATPGSRTQDIVDSLYGPKQPPP